MKNLVLSLFFVAFLSSCVSSSHAWYQPVMEEDVTFVRDPHVSRRSIYNNSQDTVLLMQGFIDPKYFVVLNDPTIDFSIKGGAVDLSQIFSIVYLQIGDSMFSYVPGSGDTKALFQGSSRLEKWTSVKMFARVKQNVCLHDGVRIKSSTLNLSDFSLYEYACNGEQVESTLGGIPGISVVLDMFQ